MGGEKRESSKRAEDEMQVNKAGTQEGEQLGREVCAAVSATHEAAQRRQARLGWQALFFFYFLCVRARV